MSFSLHHALIVLATLACVFSLGCGSGAPFSYKKVSGRVVFDDGVPVTRGKVIFDPQSSPVGEAHPRAGAADLDSEGRFSEATTFKPGDGIVAGKHKVAIMFTEGSDGKASVDPIYANVATTPVEVDTADLPFEIVVKRP